MPGSTFLSGDRLTLRTVESDDYEFVARHANAESIRRWIDGHTPRSRTELEDSVADESAVSFLPCREGEPVGYIWLFQIDDIAGHSDVGYWIVDDEQGNGYATEALSLAAQYAFEERRLHKLGARVFEGNDASARVLETVGFQREGRLREHHTFAGEYVDATLYGLLESEFDR